MATTVLIALAVCGLYWLLFALGNWFPGTGAPKPQPKGGGGRG